MIKNKITIKNGYYILNCNRGFVLLDFEDIKNLPDRTISVHCTEKYAYFKFKGKSHKLHRFLMDIVDPKVQVDHINGNPLDNRRVNLRIANNQLNCRNRSNRKNSKIKYKGVIKTPQGSYMARIQISKDKRLCLGRFSTPEEAAMAYNEAAILHHKEFARLNIIEEF